MSEITTVDWDKVREEFISGRDIEELSGALGMSKLDLYAIAEKEGWVQQMIFEKRLAVSARSAFGDDGDVDSAINRDVEVQNEVANVAEIAIRKLPGVISLCKKPNELLSALRANDVAYETYRKVRGLDEGGDGSGESELLNTMQRVFAKNRQIATDKRLMLQGQS